MKHKIIHLLAPAVLCCCLFFIQGCKEPIIEDTKLLTSDDNLNLKKDTLYTKVFSEFQEALSSNGVSTGLLGNLSDPNFGNTYAGIYAQCQLTSNNISFGTSPVLDSAVLLLKYSGQYGKFNVPVDISVYELAQSMAAATTYKTNDAFAVNLPPIGKLTGFVPKINDTVFTLQGIFPPHLRVTLDASFGNKILLADSATVLSDNTQFLNLFKGFYITTGSQTAGNGAVYLDLRSIISGITLFYHNAKADSLSYTLPISGVTVNHFDNIYTGTPVSSSIASPHTNGEEKMYLQAGTGVKDKIFIQNLDSLPKNIAINKAEFIFSQTAADTAFAAPLLLNLYRIDDAGQAQHLEDEGAAGFGGVVAAETVNGKTINRYRFNIKNYFQRMLHGIYSNKGFYLETIAPNSNSERVVIANSSMDKDYQITLVITYTKL